MNLAESFREFRWVLYLISEGKMKVNGLGANRPEFLSNKPKPINSTEKFGDMLSDFVKDVNKDQLRSNEMINEFLTGGDVELHEVMIAGEKAKTSLQLLTEIRNKAIDMYKELTRIS